MWYTVVIMFILDIGGLLLIYVLLRDRVKRATSSDAQIAEVRDEVSRLLVELNRTTDRNIALIEDRITSLNELLSAADKKIGLLRRESEKHDVGTQVYSRLAEGRPRMKEAQPFAAAPGGIPAALPRQERDVMVQPRQEREELPQPRQEREGVAVGMPPGAAAEAGAPRLSVELSERPAAGAVAQSRQERDLMPPGAAAGMPPGAAAGMPPGAAAGMPPGAAAGSSDLHQRVIMLHNAGFEAPLIAGRVGVPLGEVELIISLQKRKARV